MHKKFLTTCLFSLILALAFQFHWAYAESAADAEMNNALDQQEESETQAESNESGVRAAIVPTTVSTANPVPMEAPAVPPSAPLVESPSSAVSEPGVEPVEARDVVSTEQKKESPAAEQEAGSDETSVRASSNRAALGAAAEGGQLMLADFNTGDKPNNLGGDFGAWDKDPSDDTQSCRATFASDDVDGDMEGFALRLDYDVDSPNPAYNGFWMKLENLNALPYDTLSLYVRGVSQLFSKRMKIELKTPDGRSSSFMLSGISEQWQKFEVPLRRFKGIKDWHNLGEMVLVFDDVNTAPKKGTLLVDQIMLERLSSSASEPAADLNSAPEPLAQPAS